MRSIYEIEKGDFLTKIEWDWVNGGHIKQIYICEKVILINKSLSPPLWSLRYNNVKSINVKNVFSNERASVDVELLRTFQYATPVDIVTVKFRLNTR